MDIPIDFPHFTVPGQKQAMDSLRALFWKHYPPAGPKATLWDEWLSSPALWPAVETENRMETFRDQWRAALSSRTLDAEGYIATHQHASIAHPLGWPFPFWNQGQGGCGWHFSFKDTVGLPWRPNTLSTPEGWTPANAADGGIKPDGWSLNLTAPEASVTTPECRIDTFQAPFVQLRWRATGLGNAQPYVEWMTAEAPQFGPERRLYFDPVEGSAVVHTALPLYQHPHWTGEIARLRLGFSNRTAGGTVVLQALFTQYDTRHNINNANFVQGCATYFYWTGDLSFLRKNIIRMRAALRYVMTELQAHAQNVVVTSWVGHDGRAGLQRSPDGAKTLRYGHGIGNNYWDLMPFGCKDAYATIHYYAAVQRMIVLERAISAHPEWNIPGGVWRLDPDALERHAAAVKTAGNRLFWNPEAGRFVPGIDADGNFHDYGLTFLNLEAIAYDFATPAHAKEILSWIAGERTVGGDTAQGADIYHWRFAPRATTRRNLEYYGWFWSDPESIPWGGQVQDGGAVLGFSYHDLMARLKTRGPNDAWQRLQEIVRWFEEVEAAGGYRAYYNGTREGTLQGGGTAGGLGLDQEFFESVLVPQVLLDGFLGFAPLADGFRIHPRLPDSWPELIVDRIRYRDLILRIRVTNEMIEIRKQGRQDAPLFVYLPFGEWKAVLLAQDGRARAGKGVLPRRSDGAVELRWEGAAGISFKRGHY